MSFLNRSVLQERAAAATVEKHPLLKECDVPPNVKQVYLQGCVLAVLERDDGKVTDAARQELLRLGKSLELSDADCAEAISIVSALQTPEDQGQFLDELFPVLSGENYPKFFMLDFQSLIAKGGQMTNDKKQTVDYFGKSLTGKSDWRSAIAASNAKCLMMSGTETSIGTAGESLLSDLIVVAEVLTCETHPNSDHLYVCKVTDGKETFQVVCGAPNMRKGIKTAFAKIGAPIPGFLNKNGIPEKIRKGKLRGVESFGMCCCEKELCIGEGDDGIIEYPAETANGTFVRDLVQNSGNNS